jgi:pimeloyl-ACP methyl ester carboxylesterase
MHYIDQGKGDIILFIHGTPSWSFEYRNVIKKLSVYYRCIAIDHIGFGLSDKPKYYDYSTKNHSKTLETFILDQQLYNITLVVHDFGGPIGLAFAIKHADRIKNLVILNSWMWSCEQDPEFIKMNKLLKSSLLPFLYRYFNFSPRYLLPRTFGENRISKKILRQYTSPFATCEQREGTLAFAKSLLNDHGWFQALWYHRQSIAAKPTLFIWGMKDPFIKFHHLDKFQKVFDHFKTVKLEECGHFPQEEQPVTVSNSIFDFLKSPSFKNQKTFSGS